MKIVAMAIGSRGDVVPFIALGKELKKRGHQVTIACFPRFQNLVEDENLLFAPINGDEELMMRLLLSELKKGKDYLKGLEILLNKNPEMLAQGLKAAEKADLLLYILLGGFAYTIAEKLKIPCVRTFFYPFDRTKKYSIQNPAKRRNTLSCELSYLSNELGMNIFTKKCLNPWRQSLGLPKWKLTSSYLKMQQKPLLTLYAFSELLVPRGEKWGGHIHLTGFWSTPQKIKDYQPAEELKKFLAAGEPPLYIGFGSISYSKMADVQTSILAALQKTGQRAILSSAWSKFEKKENKNICYVDDVPHEWLFPQVKAVVHHGGAGTTYQGLIAQKPTFIIAFGGDQYFWGRQIAERKLGPPAINLNHHHLSVSKVEKGLRALNDPLYQKNVSNFSQQLAQEKSCQKACDILEKEFSSQ